MYVYTIASVSLLLSRAHIPHSGRGILAHSSPLTCAAASGQSGQEHIFQSEFRTSPWLCLGILQTSIMLASMVHTSHSENENPVSFWLDWTATPLFCLKCTVLIRVKVLRRRSWTFTESQLAGIFCMNWVLTLDCWQKISCMKIVLYSMVWYGIVQNSIA